MRALKFIGVFLGTLVLVFFIVFGFHLDALKTLFNNGSDLKEGQKWVSKTTSLQKLTQYIAQQPNRVAVVSRSELNPDSTIDYQGQHRHTMGAIGNFFLLATYARLVENEQLNPDELISIKRVDRYQLPYINSSNHDGARSEMEGRGLLHNGKIKLNKLVQLCIVHNDLAIADFLYYKLGKAAISQTYKKLDLTSTDQLLPFSGLYITLNPALSDSSFDYHFSQLQQLSAKSFRDTVLTLSHRYAENQKFHQRVKRAFNEHEGLDMGFKERRDILGLFPKSTALELSQLMIKLQQDSLISKPVSQRIRGVMDWPYERKSLNHDFSYYGAIYDNRMGLLAGIDYGASTYSKEPFGQTVFFDSLQVAFWFHMSSNLMNQDYQQRLMWDPALRKATRSSIKKFR